MGTAIIYTLIYAFPLAGLFAVFFLWPGDDPAPEEAGEARMQALRIGLSATAISFVLPTALVAFYQSQDAAHVNYSRALSLGLIGPLAALTALVVLLWHTREKVRIRSASLAFAALLNSCILCLLMQIRGIGC